MRSFTIQKVKFVGEGPGRYISTCGRWGVFHMCADQPDAQWEVRPVTKDGLPDGDLLDYGIRLVDIFFHAERGDFKLG